MSRAPQLEPPRIDPTPIFEHFRGNYGTELLTAAVAHFRLFDHLASGPRLSDELRGALRLATRPWIVLTTALRAMGLLHLDAQGRLAMTALAQQHLCSGAPFDVTGYLELSADSPGVREMIERLETNLPRGHKAEEQGVGFIYRDDLPSAMEQEASARSFTLALAGRAKNVAPVLAARAPLSDRRVLLDVGGGTGIYSIACLQHSPALRAIVWDRPEVLKVAHEMASEYGVADRLELCPGDMFVDPVPDGVDAVLLSNILHDWDVPDCQRLLHRLSAALPPGGQLWIHDVFLSDALDGPLPLALYSAALFAFTEGRAYSAAEYRGWLAEAGLKPEPIVPTLIHCGLLAAAKS